MRRSRVRQGVGEGDPGQSFDHVYLVTNLSNRGERWSVLVYVIF